VIRGLALLFPPVVGLASVHALYLRNQQELEHTPSVLYPFWAAALLGAAVGHLLQRLDRFPIARVLLWVYYTAGGAFLAWGFLRGLGLGLGLLPWFLDTAAGAEVFGALWLGAVCACDRLGPPRSVEPLLAAIAVALVAIEGAGFARRLERLPRLVARDAAAEVPPSASGAPANVYHIILDAFPDESFDAALAPDGPDALQGFVRFPRTRASGVFTLDSLPAVFTGNRLPGGSRAAVQEALSRRDSLPGLLGAAGYRRVAFLPRAIYALPVGGFDHVLFHDENVSVDNARALHAAVFRRLWFFSNAPLALTQAGGGVLRLDPENLRSIRGQRWSTYTQPVQSRLSLEHLRQVEASLPARGRYTLVHALLPHPPYLLRGDCSFGSDRDVTDLHQQSACTLRLVLDFLRRLRELGRYEDATIVIHGDHGVSPPWGGHGPIPDDAWCTLLLVKPAGAAGALRVSDEPARLLDITPTLAAALGLSPGYATEGRILPLR
jgi:sulfatase-like protein